MCFEINNFTFKSAKIAYCEGLIYEFTKVLNCGAGELKQLLIQALKMAAIDIANQGNKFVLVLRQLKLAKIEWVKINLEIGRECHIFKCKLQYF